MPTLTIYTDPNRIGTCDVPPFVSGDATNAWTLKFHNGTAYYAPASVAMRIGNINGITSAQASAFRWWDRAGNSGLMDIALASNIPTLSIASFTGTTPVLVGGSGVNLIRGVRSAGGQVISRLEIVSQGYNSLAQTIDLIFSGGGGTGAAGTVTSVAGAGAVSVALTDGGSGYLYAPNVGVATQWGATADQAEPIIRAILTDALNQTPYKTDEATQAIIGAVELVPYSDGRLSIGGELQYDHSFCIIKPRDVATASLSQSGTDWVGSMDPINAWVTALLGLRRSVSLDIQIVGDSRMLFEGVLTILNKIA